MKIERKEAVLQCNRKDSSAVGQLEEKTMTNGEFKVKMEARTVAFSVSVLKLLKQVPLGIDTRNIRDQLARSATAMGANYREANRAESRGDFAHKIAIVAKEASESEYWLTLLRELYPSISQIEASRTEAGELVRIFDKIRNSIKDKTAKL